MTHPIADTPEDVAPAFEASATIDAAESPAASGASDHLLRQIVSTIALTLLAVGIGAFFAAQFQTRPLGAETAPDPRRDVAASTIERLELEQADLKHQIAELRERVATEQEALAAGEGNVGDITTTLETQKILAGMVAVHGPGIRIMFDDSGVAQIPPNEDPSMYIVHEYQLRDIVNVLWGAGAEAISINGERIVGPTSIYCVGSTILINDTRTSPAYEFLVIGDPERLTTAIEHPDNLRALKSRIKVYELKFATSREDDVIVPAFDGSLDVRHVTLPTPTTQQKGESTN